MVDVVDRALGARNLFERLGAQVPGFRGYLDRELRREVDQMLRAELAARLDRARAAVAAHVRRLSLDAAAKIARLDAVAKSLDATANTIRHAGSGYGGFFDAVKIREEQLVTLYRHDLATVTAVDAVVETAAALGGEGGIDAFENAVAAVRRQINERDAVVRSIGPA